MMMEGGAFVSKAETELKWRIDYDTKLGAYPCLVPWLWEQTKADPCLGPGSSRSRRWMDRGRDGSS